MQEVIRFQNISKSFGQVKVLTDVSFAVKSASCVALMGENGAGKSTLMKVLSGIYPYGDYEGQMQVFGETTRFQKPMDAEKLGVAIIHQELSFFSHLTVAENIFAGHWYKRGLRIDWDKINLEAGVWLKRVGADVQPTDKMKDLSVGSQQLVEIAKALSRNSKILVLDEPTSALSSKEVEKLFNLMNELKHSGVALIYISHKMDEIFKQADQIVVLRDGKIVGDKPTREWTRDALIKSMVGRDLNSLFPDKPTQHVGNVVLEAIDLRVKKNGMPIIGPVNFELRKGEILGIGGLLGSGRTELLKALYGVEDYELSGELKVRGAHRSINSPRHSLREKSVYLSEDRKRESVLKKRSLLENLRVSDTSIRGLFKPLRSKPEELCTLKRLSALKVKYHTTTQDILSLSGGNQQKIILGRILEVVPDIIMLDEPTRGVDVGAKYEIYQILFELADKGHALLIVSSELPELLGLCDRVMVLSQGKQMSILEQSEMSPERVMSFAFGLEGVS